MTRQRQACPGKKQDRPEQNGFHAATSSSLVLLFGVLAEQKAMEKIGNARPLGGERETQRMLRPFQTGLLELALCICMAESNARPRNIAEIDENANGVFTPLENKGQI
jgi:hypothetical protein